MSMPNQFQQSLPSIGQQPMTAMYTDNSMPKQMSPFGTQYHSSTPYQQLSTPISITKKSPKLFSILLIVMLVLFFTLFMLSLFDVIPNPSKSNFVVDSYGYERSVKPIYPFGL